MKLNSILKVFLSTIMTFNLVMVEQAGAQNNEPPFKLPEQADLEKIRSAVIRTEIGDILVELFPKVAPWHVANFKYLADLNYYDNTYVSFQDQQLAVQLGAASSKKEGMLGYTLPPEFNDQKHEIGVLSMARPQDSMDPSFQRRSHPAQFNIILGNAHHMNGNYTVFGKVIRGMQVAQQLQVKQKIKQVIVFVKR